eukprot:gene8766-11143_t
MDHAVRSSDIGSDHRDAIDGNAAIAAINRGLTSLNGCGRRFRSESTVPAGSLAKAASVG